MGYNLYLVKEKNWWDKGNIFSQDEWDGIEKNYEIPDGLYFLNGEITIKNPSKEQVIMLVEIAGKYGWNVQGDDGERYSDDGSPIPEEYKEPGIFQKIQNLIVGYWAKKKIQRSMKGVTCPFKVGDKVKTLWRTGGEVIEVDEKANYGLGSIKVRFPDGTIIGGWFKGHGFEKEEAENTEFEESKIEDDNMKMCGDSKTT